VFKNIIFVVIVIICIIFCIWSGYRYNAAVAEHKKSLKIERDRVSKYFEQLESANGNIAELELTNSGYVAELGKYQEIIGRTEENNRKLADENKKIRDATSRAETRNRESIAILESIIKQRTNDTNNIDICGNNNSN